MAQGRGSRSSEQRAGHWFPHIGACQAELESTTSAALRHVLDSAAAQGEEFRLPLEYKAGELKAGNENFPFSSHDNKHCICNAAEYFDLGLGLKKFDPEKQQVKAHNFFGWAGESNPGRDNGLTTYQTSFMVGESTQNTVSPVFRRYPRDHTKKWCIDNPVPENEKDLQLNKTS